MYGGWDPTAIGNNTKYFDDMYVLSLPSFTWIKMFEGESPRYGPHMPSRRRSPSSHNRRKYPERKHYRHLRLGGRVYCRYGLADDDMGSVFTAGYQPFELSNGLIEQLGGTAQGNATLREPALGWASTEFENVMCTSRVYSDLEGTLNVSRPGATKPSPLSSRACMAIVTTVTIVGTFSIASVLLLWLRRRRRNKTSAAHSAEIQVGRSYEVEEKAKFELSPNGKKVSELSGEGYMHEATDGAVSVEADRSNIVVGVAELPATNFSEKGRWGVPLIMVPSPDVLDAVTVSEKEGVAKTQ